MKNIIEHNADQQRNAMNLADSYSVWIEAERATFEYRYRWRISNGIEYLYKIKNNNKGNNITISMGPRSPETEALYEKYMNYETIAKSATNRSLLLGRMYKSAKLPTIVSFAGDVLRSLDKHNLLGNSIQVIGTNALAAYQLEAQCSMSSELEMTEDFDLTWRVDKEKKENSVKPSLDLLDVIKESDATWTVSTEHTFRLINKNAQIIELLVPPSLFELRPKGVWRAVETKRQEDLLGGRPIEHVVADMSGRPARIVAPDPRLFALHKWLLAKTDEPIKPQKRIKDQAQSLQLRDLIVEYMPHYPFDKEFLDGLSDNLRSAWKEWPVTKKKSKLQM